MRLSALLLTTAPAAIQDLADAVKGETLTLPYGGLTLDKALQSALMSTAHGFRETHKGEPHLMRAARTKLAKTTFSLSSIGDYVSDASVSQLLYVQAKTRHKAAGIGIASYASLQLTTLAKNITNYRSAIVVFEHHETPFKEAFKVMQSWRDFLKSPPVAKSNKINIEISQTQEFDNMYSAVAYAGLTD